MKHLTFLLLLLISCHAAGQDMPKKEQYLLKVWTLEKQTQDTLRTSILEVFSGERRIATGMTSFAGEAGLSIPVKDIVDDRIRIKVHGLKCRVLEKTFAISSDMTVRLYPEYGETDYTHPNQSLAKKRKLKIKLIVHECNGPVTILRTKG